MSFFDWGQPRDRGNLVGVQTNLTSQDFRSAKELKTKLRTYLTAASGFDVLNRQSVVVFGEYLGAWLVAVDELDLVYLLTKQNFALAPIALRRSLSMIKLLAENSEATDRLTEAFFRLKAQDIAESYVAVFSALAREFDVTIVAGSVVLPNPAVINNTVAVGTFPLYNCTLVFKPDGSLHSDFVVKQNLIARESSFTSAGVGSLPVFETPAGKMGVLICADSWHSECYDNFVETPDFVVVPAYISHDDLFLKPWQGYDSTNANVKFDASDIGKISERDAWHKYALPAQLARKNIAAGMNVFSRGNFWDAGSDGRSFGVRDGKIFEVPAEAPIEAICNLWL